MTNPKSKGGYARAISLTEDQRKSIAIKGVEAKKRKKMLPKETHVGELHINDVTLNVSVLDNGIRVISHTSVFTALGRTSRGYRRNDIFDGTDIIIPAFMDAQNLKPFYTEELIEFCKKIEYVDFSGKVVFGYNANILPSLCDLYLTARENGAVTSSAQLAVVQKTEILVRGLSRVGIIALVDEVTGYQKDRAKNALAKILEEYVAKELQRWVKIFPSEYYEQLFRIYGLEYPPENLNARPGFMGRVTNDVVYSRLAPNLLEALKDAEEKSKRRGKSGRLHQHLTPNEGRAKLIEHLGSIVTLLKLSKTKEQFFELVDQIHPKFIDIENSLQLEENN